MGLRRWLLALTLVLGGCSPSVREPLPGTPSADVPSPAVVRRPLPETAAPGARSVPPVSTPMTGISVPPDAIYVCIVENGGGRSQTVIEFAPKVLELCRKHPEMGPCQYERETCRRSGGRVFAANGQEITAATEAEYDRKVLRVRFRAN